MLDKLSHIRHEQVGGMIDSLHGVIMEQVDEGSQVRPYGFMLLRADCGREMRPAHCHIPRKRQDDV